MKPGLQSFGQYNFIPSNGLVNIVVTATHRWTYVLAISCLTKAESGSEKICGPPKKASSRRFTSKFFRQRTPWSSKQGSSTMSAVNGDGIIEEIKSRFCTSISILSLIIWRLPVLILLGCFITYARYLLRIWIHYL